MRAGRTVALERRRGGGEPVDAILLPGLVDAHAHLDLGGGARVPATGSFPDWLWAIGGVRGDGRDVEAQARAQARALRARGVVALGDVDAVGGAGHRARRGADLGGRSYLEIVGVHLEGARTALARVLGMIDRSGGVAAGLALSPHASYSVHERVLPEVARAARRRGLPLAMHLAESTEETRYLVHGDGPFVRFLERVGKGSPFSRPPGLRPVAYAEAAGLLAAGCVVVHGNDLDDDDVGRLARVRAPVVYCHGTHRWFDRPPHRWLDLRAAGVDVALGTDSGSSNEDVDMVSEIGRILADRPDVDPLLVLDAATRAGRVALGLDEGACRFEAGSSADAVLVGGVPDDVETLEPRAVVAATFTTGTVLATFRAGRPSDVDTPRTQG